MAQGGCGGGGGVESSLAACLPSAVMWRPVAYIALLMTVIEWDDCYHVEALVQTSCLPELRFSDLYNRGNRKYYRSVGVVRL